MRLCARESVSGEGAEWLRARDALLKQWQDLKCYHEAFDSSRSYGRANKPMVGCHSFQGSMDPGHQSNLQWHYWVVVVWGEGNLAGSSFLRNFEISFEIHPFSRREKSIILSKSTVVMKSVPNFLTHKAINSRHYIRLQLHVNLHLKRYWCLYKMVMVRLVKAKKKMNKKIHLLP